MSTVETVQGPVDAGELGLTLIHEHVRFRDEAIARNWPQLYDPNVEFSRAVDAVFAAKEHGVQTIVDPTAMFGGRDVRFMKQIADVTGVNIVPCTGIYTYEYLPHAFENRDADQIAELFVADITEGVQGSEIKAAFIKCAADEPGVTESIEKIHRAAARASLQTGAPVMAHSRPASNTGPRQVEIFLEEGLAPGKIQIAHCGDSPDVEYVQGLIDKGVYVGLDRYGLEMFLPIDQRNAVTAELLRRGHAEQLTISQDYTVTLDWFPGEMEQVEKQFEAAGAIRNWSMTLVFEEVIPWLREQGALDDAAFETIFLQNPRRWLSGS
jgi:phosphotriesterase-related protein